MRLLLEMAQDLQIRKVVALYDGDKSAIQSCKEDRQDYYCKVSGRDWRFLKLETEDIMDKESECKVDGCRCKDHGKYRVGTFDKNGVIKPKYRQKFEKKLARILKYFGESL